MINPNGRYKLAWDFFFSSIIVLCAVYIPYWQAFYPSQYSFDDWFDGLYWFTTACFLLDLAIVFNTAIIERQRLITNRLEIAKYHARQWYIVPMIAALPIGPLLFLMFGDSRSVEIIADGFLILRLAYLARLSRVSDTLEKLFSISPAFMRLTQFAFWFGFFAHCFAIGWIAIGGAAAIEKDFNIIKALTDTVPAWERYLRSLYFVITTMATIGFGDISPHKDSMRELGYTIFVQVVGVGMFSYIVGNVSSMLANLDMAKSAFRRHTEEINAFMRSKNIPQNLQNKVRNYYEYMWETNQSLEDESALHKLPTSLALEVQLYLNRSILKSVPFFNDADEIFIRALIPKFRRHMFLPGDFIIRKGEYGDSMYFINSGYVSVIREEGSIATQLGAGSHIGEMALVSTGTRVASVKAEDFCEVYELTKERFDDLRSKFPIFDHKVKEVVAQREADNRK